MINSIPPELLTAMLKDRQVRQAITRESLEMFISFYLGKYLKYPSPEFHHIIFRHLQNEALGMIGIVAFRGSAKSTIVNLAYSLWAILGKQQKKFVLIVAQTQEQARQFITNIKEELEHNELLKADLGPFQEEDNEWRSSSVVIPKYGARIRVISIEQSIRGSSYLQNRPDLVICDDIENTESIKTIENRDKTYFSVKSELIPAGDIDTRFIFIGNLLHHDSTLMRLKDDMKAMKDSIFVMFPLLDADGKSLWPGKYPSPEAIQKEQLKISNEVVWQREYLLRIIPDSGQVILPTWISRYTTFPARDSKELPFRYTAIGIDLAISKKDSADFTTAVSADVYGHGDDMRIYIHAYPINKRLSSYEATDAIDKVYQGLKSYSYPKVFVEDVGMQSFFIEMLKKQKSIDAEGVKPKGEKRERLALISYLLQGGKVFFPEKGVEVLTAQLLGFGSERHDDLADAFSLLLAKIAELNTRNSKLTAASIDDDWNPHPDYYSGVKFENIWNKKF